MQNRSFEAKEGFTFYYSILGGNQAHLTVSVSNQHENSSELAARVYDTLLDFLQEHHFYIIHERIFASLEFRQTIPLARQDAFSNHQIHSEQPFTFIEGNPVYGKGLAGVQIRAFRPEGPHEAIWMIQEDGTPVGRGWKREGATHVMLQNVYGDAEIQDRYAQSCDMFDRSQAILKQANMDFRNVVRTWIYLDHILDWYDQFNRARNKRFTEFGLLGLSEKENTEAEQIYLPASTGILGKNPHKAAGTMDVWAVAPDHEHVKISQTSGVEQKSPYRYGSAFSRAITLREQDITHILLSGTASINEHGKSVHLNNPPEQMRKTFNVVQSLIQWEGASLKDIQEATVFFKCAEDAKYYEDIAREFGIPNLPAIFVVADVCRDDLLFEIDAAIAF